MIVQGSLNSTFTQLVIFNCTFELNWLKTDKQEKKYTSLSNTNFTWHISLHEWGLKEMAKSKVAILGWEKRDNCEKVTNPCGEAKGK